MRKAKAVASKKSVKVLNKAERVENIKNGLTEALLGFNPATFGTQLNQTDTIFANLRTYLISNMRQPLSQAYVEHGLIQTIVDVPVNDGLRGGIEIKSKQLDPEEIEKLTTCIARERDLTIAGEACKWNRLFGGAGIIIMTDQDPAEPLDLEAISEESPLEFRAVDMWELFWDKQNIEGYNIELQTQEFEHYNYYGKKLHKSRVMALKGLTAPSFVRPRLRGWGFSVVEALVCSINQYLKSNNLIFEVLDEFKLDIFKIKNLTNTLLAADGVSKIQQRVQLANMQKNFQNALTMDSEDDFLQKQLTFSGLADMMKEFRMQIASDMRMPLTKLFGISATGFNSGEDDIENYNAMVESEVREKLKFDILRMVEIRCQKLFGIIPDDLSIEFKPLRIMSAEQQENVKTQKYNRLIQARQAGEITVKEFRDGCNKGNLLEVQLEVSDELLSAIEDGQAVDEDGNPTDDIEKGDDLNLPAPKQVGQKHQAKEAKQVNAWEEGKHPRADDGKFGAGASAKVETKTEALDAAMKTEEEAKAQLLELQKGEWWRSEEYKAAGVAYKRAVRKRQHEIRKSKKMVAKSKE